MKLEQIVTNKELSIRLKELGVEKESYFVWYMNKQDKIVLGDHLDLLKFGDNTEPEIYAALTSSEIGEILPADFLVGRDDFDKYYCYSDSNIIDPDFMAQNCETMVDAMGLMLEYLLTNGLLKLK